MQVMISRYLCLEGIAIPSLVLLLFAGDIKAEETHPSDAVSIGHGQLSPDFSDLHEGKSWKDWSTMTGDWNGRRITLLEEGITFSSSYVNDILGCVSGGKARGIAEAGSFGIFMNVDFGKFSHFDGLQLGVSVVYREGTNLSKKKIGNQFTVAQVYGGQTYHLNEFYLEQTFLDATLKLKGGRLDAGNDFLQSDLYYEFVNNGFDGNPVAIFYNSPFSAYPNATWGIVLQVTFWEKIVAKMGIYNANANVVKNRYHGFNWSFHSTDGALLIGEWALLVNQGKGDTGYPGNYRVGAYYYTGTEKEKFLGGKAHGNYGYYILLDQMVVSFGDVGAERGITPFIALLFAPSDRDIMPFFLASGLVCWGLFPARPKDSLNLGFLYGKYSTDMRKAQQQAKNLRLLGPFGDQPQNFEALIEFNYWFEVNPWLAITPDLQYIINPSGFGTIPNALACGVQVGFTF